MVLDLTQVACPACALKSSLLPEVRGGHIAEGLPCPESTELESQGRTPVGTDGGGSLSSWLGGASGGWDLRREEPPCSCGCPFCAESS